MNKKKKKINIQGDGQKYFCLEARAALPPL
jgi:hypothetical protein